MNRQIALVLLAAAPLMAADALSMTPPVLGYSFDESAQAIRLIAGIPGASSLGAAEIPGLQTAWVNSSRKVAIAITKDAHIAVASWGGAPQVTLLDTSLITARQVAFSASGAQAVLSDGDAAEVWTNLDTTPVKAGRIHPDAGIAAIAINHEGVVAVATPSGLILQFVKSDAGNDNGYTAQPVATGGNWTALAFVSDSDEIIAAEGDRGELVRLTSAGGRSAVAAVGSGVTAIAVAAEGNQIAVASSHAVAVVRENGDVISVACKCEPRGFEALQGNLVLRIVEAGGTIRILDADAAEPRVITMSNISEVAAGGSAQ
ncbi:MAG: hypothetical protein ABI811_10545 [Acidobacteriota bacterium]